MKNKKGFTLIELLAVIVILGILISISAVSVSNVKQKQDEQNKENVISSILTGAKAYVAENPNKLNNLPIEINISDIKASGYVDLSDSDYEGYEGEKVTISVCSNNELKLQYSFKGYNDCGCEEQATATASKICTN